MRTLTLALSIIGLSSALAHAQGNVPQPSPPSSPPPRPMQFMSSPMPQISGCMWASKIYSNGATFCVSSSTWLACKDGKWESQDANHCAGAPFLKPE